MSNQTRNPVFFGWIAVVALWPSQRLLWTAGGEDRASGHYRAAVAALRPNGIDTPHPDRFDPERPDFEACMTAHREAVEAGDMGYFDPTTGLFVMTAAHLAGRDCCTRGCRHCPWVT